jgi:diadenosine tetraphosphate (Ap4A) HIT family hydrolase
MGSINKIEYNQNNIFKKIIDKHIPANIVLEDESCMAFYDITPQAKTHILIIPKLECVDFEDFLSKAKEIRYFFEFITKVVQKLGLSDYQLKTNKGRGAGQEVFHFHVHLLSNL